MQVCASCHRGVRCCRSSRAKHRVVLASGNPLAPEGVLRRLPAVDLRRLIERQGEVLGKYPQTWTSLWRSDVPEALDFVARVIGTCDAGALRMFFYRHGWPYPVSRRMLHALTPVLNRFSPSELGSSLGHLALLSGHRDWVRQHIIPHRHNDRDPNFGRDRCRIAAWMGRQPAQVDRLVRERETLFDSIVEVLRNWLSAVPVSEQMLVAANLVEEVGTGADLEWWTAVPIPSESAREVERVTWLLRRRRWHPSTSGS